MSFDRSQSCKDRLDLKSFELGKQIMANTSLSINCTTAKPQH